MNPTQANQFPVTTSALPNHHTASLFGAHAKPDFTNNFSDPPGQALVPHVSRHPTMPALPALMPPVMPLIYINQRDVQPTMDPHEASQLKKPPEESSAVAQTTPPATTANQSKETSTAASGTDKRPLPPVHNNFESKKKSTKKAFRTLVKKIVSACLFVSILAIDLICALIRFFMHCRSLQRPNQHHLQANLSSVKQLHRYHPKPRRE